MMDTKIYQFSKAFVARFLYAAAVSKNHDVPQFVSPYLLNMTASNSKIKLCTEYKNARVRLSTYYTNMVHLKCRLYISRNL